MQGDGARVSCLLVGKCGRRIGPRAPETTAVSVAAPHGVSAGQSDDLAIVETHAVENVAEVVGRVGVAAVGVGQTAVRGEALVIGGVGRTVGVGAAWTQKWVGGVGGATKRHMRPEWTEGKCRAQETSVLHEWMDVCVCVCVCVYVCVCVCVCDMCLHVRCFSTQRTGAERQCGSAHGFDGNAASENVEVGVGDAELAVPII